MRGLGGRQTMAGTAALCAAHSVIPADLPDALTLAVEVNGKRYGLEVKAV